MINTVHKKLSDIAQIFSGYSFREGIVPDINGKTFILSGKHIRKWDISFESLVTINIDPQGHTYLRKNDIVFKSKGPEHIGVLVEKDYNNILAAAPLMIIRLNPAIEDIQPHFLSWFINSQKAQRYFNQFSSSTTIRSITKSDLSELLIPCPPLIIQKRIVAFNQLRNREEQLINILSDKRSIFNEVVITQQLEGVPKRRDS